MKRTTLASVLCLSALLLAQPAIAAELDIQLTDKENVLVDDQQARWNSHIDNQAYLKRMRQARQYSSATPSMGPGIIVIDRQGNRDCRYRDCDSWSVQYETGNSSFSYKEGYRPTRVVPVIIVPQHYGYPPSPRPRHRPR